MLTKMLEPTDVHAIGVELNRVHADENFSGMACPTPIADIRSGKRQLIRFRLSSSGFVPSQIRAAGGAALSPEQLARSGLEI
jgi:hypothetical protein